MRMELTDIAGIGAVRKKALEESGIFSCEDLINYFPYKYYDFSKTEPFAEDGKVRLIKCTVIENAKLVRIRKNFCFVSAKMQDEVGHMFTAIWYNQTYIKSQLYLGLELYLYGKNSPTKKNTFVVVLLKTNDSLKNLGYLPVYHSVANIGQKSLHDAINFALENAEISTFVPDNLLHKYNLRGLKEALHEIHNPSGAVELSSCHERVQIENLLPTLAINEFNKVQYKTEKLQKYNNSIELKSEFESLLPYKLTIDQNKAIHDIESDLTSKFTMNRLLQGDVGSGKTAVALYGAYLAAKNGFQALIVAPTEILANQHYKTVTKIFGGTGIKSVLVTGSMSAIEKRQVYASIESGESAVIIGTHAVLSDNINYKNLTYIVIDEQHRFGVEQRARLKEKGMTPDILVMSATPIPRTLSLVVYGDLDISFIENRPKPQQTTTNIVIKSKQNDMWKYIDDKIKNGSKVYVVCSKIDEENDDEDVQKFSAKNMYDYICTMFDKHDVGLIHGKLAKSTQNKSIDSFKYGITKILVSTTIVEVGVDIPDADIMVIATPERFGLATLHQLRGRIGRNGEESYCFCLADNLNEKSYDRIQYFKNHSNGLDIADYDLKTRGAGSMIGTNQHGFDNSIFSNFSASAYSTAKQILEHLKQDKTTYIKLLEKGSAQMQLNEFKKIILN